MGTQPKLNMTVLIMINFGHISILINLAAMSLSGRKLLTLCVKILPKAPKILTKQLLVPFHGVACNFTKNEFPSIKLPKNFTYTLISIIITAVQNGCLLSFYEVYLEPCQKTTMELFCKNNWLFIFAKKNHHSCLTRPCTPVSVPKLNKFLIKYFYLTYTSI